VSVAPAGRPDHGIRIVPGQQAVLGASETLEVHEVQAESYISWIYGYLPFDNDRLSNILERLARYYNCRIECTPEAAALTLSGKLDLKDDLTEVLKILSVTAPIQLQIISPGNFRIDYNPASSRLN
jgi:fe2+-dicitrate sensor, membrane component